MKFTIKDLARGNCILYNNNSKADELKKVLKLAFPKDIEFDAWEHWKYKYFGRSDRNPDEWEFNDNIDYFKLPAQNTTDFLIAENILPPQSKKPVLSEVNRSIDDLLKLLKYQLNQIDMDFEMKIIPKYK